MCQEQYKIYSPILCKKYVTCKIYVTLIYKPNPH